MARLGANWTGSSPIGLFAILGVVLLLAAGSCYGLTHAGVPKGTSAPDGFCDLLIVFGIIMIAVAILLAFRPRGG